MNNDYNDKRWLDRANEIRRLDGYKCAMCGKSNVELHVHHLAYPPKPFHIWDATDDELVTLCKDCHMEIHNCEERPKLTEDRTLKVWNSDKCFRCRYWTQWSILEGWERDAFYMDGGCRMWGDKGCIFQEVKNCDGCAFKGCVNSFGYECYKSNRRCLEWIPAQCRYCSNFNPYEHQCEDGDVKGWCSAEGANDISGYEFCKECCSKAYYPRSIAKMKMKKCFINETERH